MGERRGQEGRVKNGRKARPGGERRMGGRRGQEGRKKNGRKEREEVKENEGRKKVGMLSLTSSQSQILIFFSLLAFG